jgi:hypothetical protein
MSHVGCLLIVASSANIRRPRDALAERFLALSRKASIGPAFAEP